MLQNVIERSFDSILLGPAESDYPGEVNCVLAFMPWVRELVPQKMNGAGLSRDQMLESLIARGGSFRNADGAKAFYENLVASPELTSQERAFIVQKRAQEILAQHFNSTRSPGWEVLRSSADTWLSAYAGEGSEEWLQEIETKVFGNESCLLYTSPSPRDRG